jgi:hypothetical protein
VVVALAAGALGFAAPAYAADLTVTVDSMGSTTLHPGDQTSLKFTVSNNSAAPAKDVNITVASSLSDVTLRINGSNCGQTCTFSDTIPQSGISYSATVVASSNPRGVGPGQQKAGSIGIQADTASASRSFTLIGPTQTTGAPPTQGTTNAVTSVSGVVKDIATGQPIPQAEVQLQDDAKHTWSVGTNSKGQFTFRSTADKPIVPGLLVVGATKDGYTVFTRSFTGVAGQAMTIPALAMTASASGAPVASGAPASAGDVGANQGDSLQANPPANNGGGGGGFSMLLIILGAVLVLLGVGAIVLILLRRKDDGADVGPDGDDDMGPRRGAPAPVPASRGAFRSGPADATMVANADAPTAMLQRTPPIDEYPDPYGAPLPPRSPQPGYPGGGYGQGYGPPPTSPYDDAPTYAEQGPANGYGGGYQGGYGDPGYGGGYGGEATTQAPGYGKPPPRPPAPADPYGAPPPPRDYPDRGYGAEQPATRGYPSQYGGGAGGRRDEPTGMFDNYDQVYDRPRGGGGPAVPGGGYPPAGPGYGDRDYDASGYEQQNGYDPRSRGGGYDPRGGYPQAGGYEDGRGGGYDDEYRGQSRHAAPPAQPKYPGQGNDQRRSLDWLDD